MTKSAPLACLLTVALFTGVVDVDAASPYVGQETREIKSLSAEDVDSYLSGKGMGLAKAAELNGYPGPAHVLALASDLGITTEQTQRTESLFRRMEARAIALGGSLVEEERRLDALFASKSIDRASLARSLKRIGELQAQLRKVHLEAHLTQVEILTPAQVSRYVSLRGYAKPQEPQGHSEHKH